MVSSIIKFVLKVALIIWLVIFIIQRISSLRLDTFFLPILFLVICLMFIKRWLPFLYNFIKRILSWTLKATASWLWQNPERKGGANVKQPRMRWRS